jgi:hypothetical protein
MKPSLGGPDFRRRVLGSSHHPKGRTPDKTQSGLKRDFIPNVVFCHSKTRWALVY